MQDSAKTFDFTLKMGSSMLVCGPTQSGKSTFVHNIIKHRDVLFNVKPSKIYWFYGTYNADLLNKPDIIITEGLPESFHNIEPNSVIILDDLMHEATNHKGVTSLFTRLVHHQKLFVISMTQNFYQQSKDARTRRLNVQYIVLFKNPADVTQINTLNRQMFPNRPQFLIDIYKRVSQRPYGYVFIDLRQDTPDDIRIRTCILPEEAPLEYFY